MTPPSVMGCKEHGNVPRPGVLAFALLGKQGARFPAALPGYPAPRAAAESSNSPEAGPPRGAAGEQCPREECYAALRASTFV